MRTRSTLLAVAASLAFSHAAMAVPADDQTDQDFTYSIHSRGFGQSFTAGRTGLLSGVSFLVSLSYNLHVAQDYKVSLYAGDGLDARTLLGSVNLHGTWQSDQYGFDVSQLAVGVTAGASYSFYLSTLDGSLGYASADGRNTYGGGSLFVDGARVVGSDLNFRTQVDTAMQSPAPTSMPEPLTAAVLGVGLAAVAVSRHVRSARRRRDGDGPGEA